MPPAALRAWKCSRPIRVGSSIARSCALCRSGATTRALPDAPSTWRSRSGASDLSGELQNDAARASALLLDLHHPQRPDLARVGHVRTAAGLQVHPVDLEQADA